MAGDWIKMRVWLSKDPKVVRMADYLARQRPFMDWLSDPVKRTCSESAYEHVTRNVTVALCVTALGVTWGTAREQGRRENDDLLIDHCDLQVLDSITELPCFGSAMEFVGWAVQLENDSVRFPNFFRDNASPEEKLRTGNAERQARHRAKRNGKSNVTCNVTSNGKSNVTVTPREEKRRVDSKKETKAKKEPFKPPTVDEVQAYCLERSNGIDPALFVAHYQAKGWMVGKNPMKDWQAAVHTWERNNVQRNKPAESRVPTDEDLLNWNPIDGGLGSQ